MIQTYSNKSIILFIILLLLGIVSALIIISDDINYKEELKQQNCSGFLTYSFYNVTTGEITHKQSDIMVCNVN